MLVLQLGLWVLMALLVLPEPLGLLVVLALPDVNLSAPRADQDLSVHLRQLLSAEPAEKTGDCC
jgi:hypothetical protein